jgi:hypothetical protein
MRRDNLKTVTLVVSLFLLALLAQSGATAITVSPAPDRGYAAQTWVGFSTNDAYTIRITLAADGTGSGILLSSGGDKSPFAVTSWRLDLWSLILSVNFNDHERSGSRIAGTFKAHVLSYNTGMLPHPEGVSANDLPGPLELTLENGANRVRFGAWPERELDERLQRIRNASSVPTRPDH